MWLIEVIIVTIFAVWLTILSMLIWVGIGTGSRFRRHYLNGWIHHDHRGDP